MKSLEQEKKEKKDKKRKFRKYQQDHIEEQKKILAIGKNITKTSLKK